MGDGPLRGMVETAVKNLHVEDCVILVGLRSDIPQLLQSFDVFMLPSFYEGMPLSVLEAQAAGLPCFISNCITKDVEIGKMLCLFHYRILLEYGLNILLIIVKIIPEENVVLKTADF